MLHTLLARRDWNRLAWPVVAIVMLLLPLLLGDGFYLNILNFVALYAMVAVGLCLLVGYGGQLSISHSAFFAIGAYASAIFSLRWGWHPWFAVAGAQLVRDRGVTILVIEHHTRSAAVNSRCWPSAGR